MRGNFWRICGFVINRKQFLYPEEALYLVEKSQLLIFVDGKIISPNEFYEKVILIIPLYCYLVYARLRVT